MTKKGNDLLEAMRLSQNNWTRRDLESLYLYFGFQIRVGRKHDIATHPEFPELYNTLPNHKSFAKGYITSAVKLIDKLKQLNPGGKYNE